MALIYNKHLVDLDLVSCSLASSPALDPCILCTCDCMQLIVMHHLLVVQLTELQLRQINLGYVG